MTEWGPLDRDKLKIEDAANDPVIAHSEAEKRPITGFVWLTTGLEVFAAPLHADQEKVIQALKKLEQEDEVEDVPTASPLTPDEFRDKMYEIVEEYGDPETTHIVMDELMCEMLRSLGYEGGVRIFEKQKRWYS